MSGSSDIFSEKSLEDIGKISSDMNLLSYFSIIYGIVLSLGLITAVIGVPLIISGVKLKKSSESLMQVSENSELINLESAFSNLRVFFKIHKLILIIAIISSALLIFGMLMSFIFLGFEIFK